MSAEEEIQSTHRDDRAGEKLSNNAALFRGIDGLAQKQSDARREQGGRSERIHRDHARGEILQQIDLSNPSCQNGDSDRGRKTTGG
jgi:hypothetical protein